MSQQLYDHQLKALRKLDNGKILCGAPGSGKSLVAATYYKEREAPRDVYVITTAKKRDSFDWQEEFYRLGIGPLSGPAPIPGDKRKVSTRGNLSRKSEGAFGSSSRGSSAEVSVARRSDKLSCAEVLSHGLQRNVSSKNCGCSGESTIYAGGNSTSLSDGSVQDVSGSKIGRKSTELQGAVLCEKSDLSVEEFRREHWSSDSSGVLRPEAGTSGSCGQSYQDLAGTFPWVLTVDSWNNIGKYADVSGAFFIFDEQRLVGSGNWTRQFLRIAKRNRWILLSGTPGDTWMDYVPVFVANDFYKNRTAFIREHVVYNSYTKFPKVERYIGVGRLLKHRSQLLVDMPFERHTKRRIVEVPLPYDKKLFERVVKDRWHVYESRPLRDAGEMFSVMRKVVNSDPSRLEMVQELWQIHPKLIVFYNFNYELEILRSLVNPDSNQQGKCTKPLSEKAFLPVKVGESLPKKRQKSSLSTLSVDVAEWNGHKHEPIPQTDRWLYLVQYTAGAEGWNCIETDAMVMYSRNYSWKITEQAYGRIDRLNTKFSDLWYYDFTTDSFIDKAIGRALKAKESFNERRYASLFEG